MILDLPRAEINMALHVAMANVQASRRLASGKMPKVYEGTKAFRLESSRIGFGDIVIHISLA